MAIRKAHELKVHATVKALLYGQPGSGKSTLGISAPRPVYIDCDNGVHRIAPQHQCDTIQVERWEDVTEILTADISDYDTIVIDTAGKMLRFMNEYVGRMNAKNKQPDGTLNLKGFGVRKELFIDFTNRISQLGKHFIMVAHDKEDKKGDQMFVRPDIGGSSGQDLIRDFDLVGYIQLIGSQRSISFEPTEYNYGKNTCGIQSLIYLPDVSKGPNNLMSQIIGDFQKGIQNRHDMGVAYMKIIEQVNDMAAAIIDAKGCNDAYKWVSDFADHIRDSAIVSKKIIAAKSKVLGLTANPVTKMFEDPDPKNANAPKATLL